MRNIPQDYGSIGNGNYDQWHRGAIVQIERIVRKERGGKVSALGRIEQDAAVHIVGQCDEGQ